MIPIEVADQSILRSLINTCALNTKNKDGFLNVLLMNQYLKAAVHFSIKKKRTITLETKSILYYIYYNSISIFLFRRKHC